MPEAPPSAGGPDFLQGWGNVVVVLVALHLLALAFWVWKVVSEPTSYGKRAANKAPEDRE